MWGPASQNQRHRVCFRGEVPVALTPLSGNRRTWIPKDAKNRLSVGPPWAHTLAFLPSVYSLVVEGKGLEAEERGNQRGKEENFPRGHRAWSPKLVRERDPGGQTGDPHEEEECFGNQRCPVVEEAAS